MILLTNYEKALYTFWYNFSLSINYTHACSKNISKAPEPCLCVLEVPLLHGVTMNKLSHIQIYSSQTTL